MILQVSINCYVDKLPVEERQIYYYTMSKLLMRQNRLQESYDNLLLAYDLFAKRDGFSNEEENLSNVSIIPTTSSLSPQYHPYMNRNEISLPVKGLTVVISGITLAFIICILTAMRRITTLIVGNEAHRTGVLVVDGGKPYLVGFGIFLDDTPVAYGHRLRQPFDDSGPFRFSIILLAKR